RGAKGRGGHVRAVGRDGGAALPRQTTAAVPRRAALRPLRRPGSRARARTRAPVARVPGARGPGRHRGLRGGRSEGRAHASRPVRDREGAARPRRADRRQAAALRARALAAARLDVRRGRGLVATIQEDFDRIDVMLRQLQVKWDLFFNGAEKKPPSELQTQVETLIKRLANAEIRNNGDRFRFQGLSSRYTTFNELWQKRIRAREEGRAFGRHGIKAEQTAPTRPAVNLSFKSDVPQEFRVSDAARDTAAVRALYEHYVEERRRVGEAAPAF